MKKRLLSIGALALTLGITATSAFAATTYKNPAEAVAGLTGQTVESVIAERRESNKTYGMIAAEAGKLDEYKALILEIKKDTLDTQVASGTITQEQADAIIKAIEENQVTCDGTGSAGLGRSMGAGFGRGCGGGMGRGMRNGSCLTNQ